jgi:nicotinate-nucleotide adenylyltransferase
VKRVGVLAGAFNPVTRAHAELARAARAHVDEIVAVVPREFPHKELHGATVEQRVEMIRLAGIADRIELVRGGLFIDIAREIRRDDEHLAFICGADAAERVIGWDYGEPGAIEKILEEISLLVAPRAVAFHPPDSLRYRIQSLEVAAGFEEISSTEVRRRIAAREDWEDLVPVPILELVRRVY